MNYPSTTLTKALLDYNLKQAVRRPHGHVHKGKLILHPDVFTDSNRETNILISRFALLDCTGSIELGSWCNISARCRIYTHDHIHLGRRPLLAVEEEHGVVWQDKKIGADVWVHDGAIILYQVTHIPDGVVIGAGSVLTKKPGAYEIWAGNPARKIGKREEATEEEVKKLTQVRGFCLGE